MSTKEIVNSAMKNNKTD